MPTLRPEAKDVYRLLIRGQFLPTTRRLDAIPRIAADLRDRYRYPVLGVDAVVSTKQQLQAIAEAAAQRVHVVLCSSITKRALPEVMESPGLVGCLSPGCCPEMVQHGIKARRGILTIPSAGSVASFEEAVLEKIDAAGVDDAEALREQGLIGIQGDDFAPQPDPPPAVRSAPEELSDLWRHAMALLGKKWRQVWEGRRRELPLPASTFAFHPAFQHLLGKFDHALHLIPHVETPEEAVRYMRADVQRALLDAVEKHGLKTPEEARRYLRPDGRRIIVAADVQDGDGIRHYVEAIAGEQNRYGEPSPWLRVLSDLDREEGMTGSSHGVSV